MPALSLALWDAPFRSMVDRTASCRIREHDVLILALDDAEADSMRF
jgi:hypothetical protein